MNTNSSQQHVNEPTRGNNILDLVMTTTDLSINGLEVTDKIGDHQMIDFSLDYKRVNFELMKEELGSYNYEVLMNNKNAEECYMILKDKIASATDHHIPRKRIRPTNNPPWFSQEIKRVINARQHSYRRLKRYQIEPHRLEWRGQDWNGEGRIGMVRAGLEWGFPLPSLSVMESSYSWEFTHSSRHYWKQFQFVNRNGGMGSATTSPTSPAPHPAEHICTTKTALLSTSKRSPLPKFRALQPPFSSFPLSPFPLLPPPPLAPPLLLFPLLTPSPSSPLFLPSNSL
ncbi:hypothetical protein FHG87_014502 [Trinorchestia longiramus]|nr:hypothetical protein FHG87_014502 [Trinorchestia longiramus]